MVSSASQRSVAGGRMSALALVLGLTLAPGLGARPQEPGDALVPPPGEELGPESEAPSSGPPPRLTIAPWLVDVLGQPYDNFANDDAAKVISDWLTNALIQLDLFHVVNRERIRAVLSERNLALSGLARDVSSDVPENELATAGRLLSVNYILLGNIKNLGTNSEIDFKLLDVATTTYSGAFRLNFQIPFNPNIERFKLVVDRIVGDLSASFPLVAEITAITPEGAVVLRAGSLNGLVEGLSAELWRSSADKAEALGVVTAVESDRSEMVLEGPLPAFALQDYVVKIALAPGAESVLSSGRLEIKRRNFERAREVLAAGIVAFPGHGRILALHAHSCWRLGDYEGAVGSYRQALEVEPNDLDLLEEAAQVLFEAGYFQELEELLAEPDQRSIDLELLLGRALAAQGYPRLAREAYKRAFRRDPEHPGPHFWLAILAARNGELSEIQRELKLAREGGSGSVTIELAGAIEAVLESGQTSIAGARPWVERAIADRDFAALAAASELLHFRPELWRQALELAEASVEINPDFLYGRRLVADALVLGSETGRAIEVLEEALGSHPNNVAMLVRSGELLSGVGRHREGELRLLQAMDLAPQQWRPADVLGDIYYRQSVYLEAIDAYQTALRIAEQEGAPDLTARLEKLGRAAVLGNQHATALPYLERCVERSPDNKECRFFLGRAYFASNLAMSNDKAIINFKAAEGFSDDRYHYLGALFDRREEFFEARDWYQRCVDVGCSLAKESARRIDEIETIRGTIVSHAPRLKQVSLDVGLIHGVQPSRVASVISDGQVIARVKTEQVLEKTSVAKILGGEPLTGHEVVFRPARPRGLALKPAPKKGVAVSWRPSAEPELAHYVIYRKGGRDLDWQERKRVSRDTHRFVDKAVKPGQSYEYRVSAISRQQQESLPSLEAAFTTAQAKAK